MPASRKLFAIPARKPKNISDNDVIGVQDAKKEGHIAAHPEHDKRAATKAIG